MICSGHLRGEILDEVGVAITYNICFRQYLQPQIDQIWNATWLYTHPSHNSLGLCFSLVPSTFVAALSCPQITLVFHHFFIHFLTKYIFFHLYNNNQAIYTTSYFLNIFQSNPSSLGCFLQTIYQKNFQFFQKNNWNFKLSLPYLHSA